MIEIEIYKSFVYSVPGHMTISVQPGKYKNLPKDVVQFAIENELGEYVSFESREFRQENIDQEQSDDEG